jgi:predicted MPP superfamily phosphohydrolase
VLRNERIEIRRGESVFDVAGIDDDAGKRMATGHGPDLDKALRGRDEGRALVLLAHQPRAVFEACKKDVGLLLSGHTHGGQIWPWRYLVYLQQPYVSGLHDHEGTQVYVSEGTGFWGPPMRLGSTAEISLVTLRSPTAKR